MSFPSVLSPHSPVTPGALATAAAVASSAVGDERGDGAFGSTAAWAQGAARSLDSLGPVPRWC